MLTFIADNAPMVGLLFFVTIYAVMAVWTLMPSHKDKIEAHRYIPLTEDSHERS